MKRAGFTMIELIFVIVILGILAAVALPKFIGVSEQAEAGKCLAAVGTMNRTVGPALWSESIMKPGATVAQKGSIIGGMAPFDTPDKAGQAILNQFVIPSACITGGNTATAANIGTTWLAGGGGADAVGDTPGQLAKSADVVIGSKTYAIWFLDGSPSSAPQWAWMEGGANPNTLP